MRIRCRQCEGTASTVLATVAAGLLVVIGSSCSRGWSDLREQMVRDQVEGRGVRDQTVVRAMRRVPRHLFIGEEVRERAYDDLALPIGAGQNTPTPYVIALMTELLEVGAGDRVLEVGTGCGYHSAVLAAIGAEVYTIEIQPGLCRTAEDTLGALGYNTVTVRCGNGLDGWPEAAPFDAILVTGAHERVPDQLIGQLVDGGNMVIPVGDFYQQIEVITRAGDGVRKRSVIPVRFKALEDRAVAEEGKGRRGES